jgi:hypothetical protein
MLQVKITNQEKFAQVSEVDLGSSRSIVRGGFDGHVYIQLENGKEIEATGQHGVRDWEDEFGFVVEQVD